MNYRIGKRTFDLVVSIIMFILLTPLFFIISVISLCFHGPKGIFFLQDRVGYKGIQFRIVKFKTMTDGKDSSGNLLPDEDRQTIWGNFLRKYSVDEFLQLINVIKGDMSLIGPRPLMEKYLRNLSEHEKERFNVRPGITGLAQVCGRNELTYYHRFKYDVWYVNHLSFALDFQILIMTIKVVLSSYGIEYNQVNEREYSGNIK